MCAIVKGAEHLVLLGDHFQLPVIKFLNFVGNEKPTVTSARAQAGGLAVSIFERFVTLGIESNLLQIQYR
jgi:superfamily I DNA and/or RNA helicase